MRASDIKEGLRYRARAFGKVTVVEVDKRWQHVAWNGEESTVWNVTEVGTGRHTKINDAQRFLEEAGPFGETDPVATAVSFRQQGAKAVLLGFVGDREATPLETELRASIDYLLQAMSTAELLRIRCESTNVQLQELCHRELFRRGATKERYRAK